MALQTYIIDLDGTLCITDEGKLGPLYEQARPIPERIRKVNELYDQGHTIIIDSARGNKSGKNWYYFTLDQLKSWGLKFHSLRTGEKLTGDFYIDDRGINSNDFFGA